jgi:hypothetical protein
MKLACSFDFGSSEIIFFIVQTLFSKLSTMFTSEGWKDWSWVKLGIFIFAKFFFLFYLAIIFFFVKLNASNLLAYVLGFLVFLPKINIPNFKIGNRKLY